MIVIWLASHKLDSFLPSVRSSNYLSILISFPSIQSAFTSSLCLSINFSSLPSFSWFSHQSAHPWSLPSHHLHIHPSIFHPHNHQTIHPSTEYSFLHSHILSSIQSSIPIIFTSSDPSIHPPIILKSVHPIFLSIELSIIPSHPRCLP